VEKIDTHDEFKAKLDAFDKVCVMFTANWCGPCQRIKPDFEEKYSLRNPKIKFFVVHVDENEETAKAYDILSLPTFMFFEKARLQSDLTFSGAEHDRLANMLYLMT
jgi:thiol-disulfide isomerase/thioredoxin